LERAGVSVTPSPAQLGTTLLQVRFDFYSYWSYINLCIIK
jgi:hypothetical protein